MLVAPSAASWRYDGLELPGRRRCGLGQRRRCRALRPELGGGEVASIDVLGAVDANGQRDDLDAELVGHGLREVAGGVGDDADAVDAHENRPHEFRQGSWLRLTMFPSGRSQVQQPPQQHKAEQQERQHVADSERVDPELQRDRVADRTSLGVNTSSDTPEVPFDSAFTAIGMFDTPGGRSDGFRIVVEHQLARWRCQLHLDQQWSVGGVDQPDADGALPSGEVDGVCRRHLHGVANLGELGPDGVVHCPRRRGRRVLSSAAGRRGRSIPAAGRCRLGSIDATALISLRSCACRKIRFCTVGAADVAASVTGCSSPLARNRSVRRRDVVERRRGQPGRLCDQRRDRADERCVGHVEVGRPITHRVASAGRGALGLEPLTQGEQVGERVDPRELWRRQRMLEQV